MIVSLLICFLPSRLLKKDPNNTFKISQPLKMSHFYRDDAKSHFLQQICLLSFITNRRKLQFLMVMQSLDEYVCLSSWWCWWFFFLKKSKQFSPYLNARLQNVMRVAIMCRIWVNMKISEWLREKKNNDNNSMEK